ncbi:glycosyltransferase family 4 protein [Echinicola soli]|uniref:Glycosyltransferase family 4 protein n=1 Tax=Echinicola soli TaxID=2591634 RepID=A0A514CJ11_9BACT|nr:glycosyltransferase family 4 protein [Echinicola soli]QDH79809.1 glycosyltransferase family 4 protein [Echinicola soli]
MKILFVFDSLTNAGTENSYLQLLPRFSNNVEVTVAYFYADHCLAGEFEDANIQVRFLANSGRYGFGTGVKKLFKLVKEEKPDLLVSSLLRSNLISRVVSKISGVPLVGTLVSDSYGKVRLDDFQGRRLLKFKLFWQLDRWTAGIPIQWIANSSFIADAHCKALGLERNKIEVIYRGREVPHLTWRESNSSKNNRISYDFVSVGRLFKTKGWTELLDAFHLVLRKYPNCTLTIFGEGPLRASLEEKVIGLGIGEKVFLPGNVPQVQDRLFDYDCFVFPSWYEGFSGALVEAMMVGIPVIASDIPMNLEAVTPHINALTFPVKDAEMLAAQMNYAMNHPEKMAELGRNARKEAIERFDIEKIAEEYEEVLKRVLKTSPSLSKRERNKDGWRKSSVPPFRG